MNDTALTAADLDNYFLFLNMYSGLFLFGQLITCILFFHLAEQNRALRKSLEGWCTPLVRPHRRRPPWHVGPPEVFDPPPRYNQVPGL